MTNISYQTTARTLAATSCRLSAEPLPKLGPLPHLPGPVKCSVPIGLQLGEGTWAAPAE